LFEDIYKVNRNNKGGYPLHDALLMFKVLVLQHFYTLSHDQTVYQVRDGYSFWHFLGPGPEGKAPAHQGSAEALTQ